MRGERRLSQPSLAAIGGEVDAASGRYAFNDLLPGTYDLALLVDDTLYVGLDTAGAGLAGEALSEADRAAIARRVYGIEDFFEEKVVLACAGTAGCAEALVRATRRGRTSLERHGGPALVFSHVELWALHRAGARWLIDGRVQLYRERAEQETRGAPIEVLVRPDLAGLWVPVGGADLELDLEAR